MREIKFRGKRISDCIWVYGYFFKDIGDSRIHGQPEFVHGLGTWHDVRSKTIGQYTGLKDKNGRDIYEGDILKIDRERKVVEWNNEKAGFAPFVNQIFSAADAYSEWNYTDNGKIIGNIHENPELLK